MAEVRKAQGAGREKLRSGSKISSYLFYYLCGKRKKGQFVKEEVHDHVWQVEKRCAS
jgi:hypothetical protein